MSLRGERVGGGQVIHEVMKEYGSAFAYEILPEPPSGACGGGGISGGGQQVGGC